MSVRRYPVGAEPVAGGVHFRVWAPARKKVSLVIEGGPEVALGREDRGYFGALVKDAGAGTLYRYRLDREEETYPDPASRFQPDGPHGPSMVVDCSAYRWRETSWRGPNAKGLVISEIHIGTFTSDGTYRAAAEKLPLLAETGINAVEVMPVNEFAGTFGWGYDGVDLWAPTHLYGTPDDFRRFIESAHDTGIAVILDVVYNHFGPDGCYLSKFTPDYFTKKYENEWGDAINFDGDHCEGVREFVTSNAAYWIDEFRLDGLRVDATQSINDSSPTHVLQEMVAAARKAAGERSVYIVGENEPQQVRIIEDYGFDAMWNDDWHHCARVAATGRREAYYTDYLGGPQEFISMARLGFLYQGQYYSWQKQRRGSPSAHIEPHRFVCYLQNHDQIANSATAQRLHLLTSPGRMRALTTLLLLSPQTPMLFQGQEFGASALFPYFADHEPELAARVAEGRREFLSQFPSMRDEEVLGRLAHPDDPATWASARLDWSEREQNAAVLQLHRDLLRLRREDEIFAAQRSDLLHGAVIGPDAFLLRWLTAGGTDRLLIVNLGAQLHLESAPEPLLAPPKGCEWQVLFSTNDAAYGGAGTPPLESEENWMIPAEAAVVLISREM